MTHTFVGEERQIIDIAKVQDVALVKVGTGACQVQVIRIDEVAVIAVRRVIERVTPGVSEIKAQASHMTVGGNLKRVIDGVSLRLKRSNRTVAAIGTVEVRTGVAASDIELNGGLARRRDAVHRTVVAVIL